jgi:trans-aconitate methyltransferase
VIGIIEGMEAVPPWHDYFRDFPFPYGFYGEEEYRPWLAAAGLNAVRVELIAKDMAQEGKEGLAGWIRTTWLPYTQRLPRERREEFIREIVDRYAELHPPDGKGLLHVAMVRLEVEAEKK